MSGVRILASGIALMIFGLLAIGAYQTQSITDPVVMTGGSALLALGVVITIFGFLSSAFQEFAPKTGIHRGDTAIFSHTLIRCMIAITVADNELEDREVKAVASIFKRVTGSAVGEKIIRETAEEMMKSGVDIIAELKNTQASLDKASKEKIIIASLHILAADGVMDQGEEMFLEDVRDGLKVPMTRFNKIKKEFLAAKNLQKRA